MRVLMAHGRPPSIGGQSDPSTLLPGWDVVACGPDEVGRNLDGVDVLCPIMAAVGPDEVAAGSFGLVQQFGAGTERVDVASATESGIWVARLPADLTGNADGVAELAMLHVLAGVRRLTEARAALRDGHWARPVAPSLFGTTVLIVGLGAVGSALARRLTGFDVGLTGIRARPERGAPDGFAWVGRPDQLHDAVGAADVVVCCAPLDDRTRTMFDTSVFAAMRPGSVFVNVARGGLVDEPALVQALDSGHVAAAGLDVFAGEPDEHDGPLQRHPRVIGTPHIAGVTQSMLARSASLFAENLQRYERGEDPRWTVNAPTPQAQRARRA